MTTESLLIHLENNVYREGEDSHLLMLIQDTILNKPKGHGLGKNKLRKCVRSMNGIGG